MSITINGLACPIRVDGQVGQVVQINAERDLLLIKWGSARHDETPLTGAQWVESVVRSGGRSERGHSEVAALSSFDRNFHDHLVVHLLSLVEAALWRINERPLLGADGIIARTERARVITSYIAHVMQEGHRRTNPIRAT